MSRHMFHVKHQLPPSTQ